MRSPRKLTALVLMGALTATSVAAVPASAKTFSDVPSNHWAYTVIDEVSNENIMVGVGNGLFAPSMQLTRAQYTAILSNLAPDKSNGTYEAHLTDVDAGAWYAEVAEWGVTNGIIYEIDGRFEGNTVLTREEMASMTLQYLNLYYKDSIKQDNSSAGYADESSINPKYLNAVNLLSNNGLLAGRGDNKFEPAGALTRAEAAAMAARLMDVADKAGTTTPEDPDEEQPPVEDPAEDPSNWDLDGAPAWFLVGQPNNITDEQWNQLITYYADKERPVNSNYPSSIKDLPTEYQHNEELAKEYCGARMDDLISIMQKDLAEQATVQALTEELDVEITAEEQEMIDLINKARTEEGKEELKVSPVLCLAAALRAEEGTTLFSHTRPNGERYETALNDVGLSKNITSNILAWENLSLMKGDTPYSANYAMSEFLKSPDHRKNLMIDKHQYVGVAKCTNEKGTCWIQLFAQID